jgi:hypothetical protein
VIEVVACEEEVPGGLVEVAGMRILDGAEPPGEKLHGEVVVPIVKGEICVREEPVSTSHRVLRLNGVK